PIGGEPRARRFRIGGDRERIGRGLCHRAGGDGGAAGEEEAAVEQAIAGNRFRNRILVPRSAHIAILPSSSFCYADDMASVHLDKLRPWHISLAPLERPAA